MYEVIDAIISGMKDAYAYREDEAYMDQNSHEYNRASDVLKTFIDQCR